MFFIIEDIIGGNSGDAHLYLRFNFHSNVVTNLIQFNLNLMFRSFVLNNSCVFRIVWWYGYSSLRMYMCAFRLHIYIRIHTYEQAYIPTSYTHRLTYIFMYKLCFITADLRVHTFESKRNIVKCNI